MKRMILLLIILSLIPLNAGCAEETVTLSCLINFDWYPVKEFKGLIPEEIEKKTGVHLDVTVTHGDQEILAHIAMGTLPDLVYTATMLDTLSNPALCYDYDELIDQYAADWVIPDVLRQNALTYSADQQLYTLLNHYTDNDDWRDQDTVPMVGSMLMRKDILEKVGNPTISSPQDYYQVLDMISEQEKDLIPLTFSVSHRFKVFRYWYGLGEVPFVKNQEDSYHYYARDDRYYQMLFDLNKAFRKGQISLDNFVASDQEILDLFKAGHAFSMSYCTQSLSGINISLASANRDYAALELPPVEGSSYDVSEIGWAGTFISRNCKHPDTAIRFIRWMFTPEAQKLTQWGVEGRDYVLDENGNPVFSQAVIESRENNTYKDVYCPWFYFGGSAVVEAKGRLAQGNYDNAKSCYQKIIELYDNQAWQRAIMNPPNSEYYLIYDSAEKIVNQYEDMLITSETEEEFDYAWLQFQRALIRVDIENLEKYISAYSKGA